MNTLRRRLHVIVFGTITRTGRRFDVVLLWVIMLSVFVVMLESVPALGEKYARLFFVIEWIMTGIFTLEYALRIWISPKPLRYIFSFWGIIDLLSILPTYLSLFISGYHYLLVVRIFRLLRVFRILKLARFSAEAKLLREALKMSLHKISIFLMSVLAIVTLLGTLMYVIEGGEEGFTSIPQSIYWAIVTLTTVGYGDISPRTGLGQTIAAIIMIIGYGIIAVPTGIVTAELTQVYKRNISTQACLQCSAEGHDLDAKNCKYCGAEL